MKRRLICCLMALLIAGSACAEEAVHAYASLDPALSEVEWTQELVRLHVIAASNTPEDQALKLKVRDAVLAAVRPVVAACADPEGAFSALEAALPEIEAAALACVRENGCTDDVHAETGVFAFPDRDYGGITVPAGEYRALRIAIGDGAGQNWWCVLYPTLCMGEVTEYYSIIGQWLMQWFGGDAQ